MGYVEHPGIRYLSGRTDWTALKEAHSGPVTGMPFWNILYPAGISVEFSTVFLSLSRHVGRAVALVACPMAEEIATQHGAELRDIASYLRARIYLSCMSTEYSFEVQRGASEPRNVLDPSQPLGHSCCI